jgi:hypothetical protein
MKRIFLIILLLGSFVTVSKSDELGNNQLKENLITYSQSNNHEVSESEILLKSDCECLAWGNFPEYQKDSILVDSCSTAFKDIPIDSCNGNLSRVIGNYIHGSYNCRRSSKFEKENSEYCDRLYEFEKSIRIKSVNFDSATASVRFLLNEDYFSIESSGVYTKDDIYPEYPEFKAYITSLENQFDIYKKYEGTNYSMTFYFEDYVNLHDFLEAAFNKDYVDTYFLRFFENLLTIESKVNNSRFQATYYNGILEVNSRFDYLESVELFDLYGNRVSSVYSLNKQNYYTNLNLNSGIYFLIINEKEIIKLSIIE